ncbi:hypothetical protein ACFSW8_17670 [Rubritalea tangerina]|uniref:Uncharacterized protein n=2 Tax=Rubritalea tangerina TaxID=430798 RepID=A0ABW4ZFE3_9BACT
MTSIFLVSCATEREVTYEKGGPEQFGDRYLSDVKYVVDEQGNVRPNQDKRSQFEAEGDYAGGKAYQGSAYGKEAYRSKRWGGDKNFNAQQFAGNKSGSQYQYSPHFVQQQANAQGQYSHVGGKNYGTSGYGGEVRAVDRGRNVGKPQDAATQSRRKVYAPPPIYSMDQVNGIGVDDTKAMMGR